MNQERVRRAGAMAAVAAFALIVLAACGGEVSLEEELEDVTRVPTTSDAAARATSEAPEEASPEAGGGTPASGEATPVSGESAATPAGTPAASPAATPVEQESVPAAPATAEAAADPVEIVSRDIFFEPNTAAIPADTDVTFVLPNEGVTAHNFSIDALDISVDQAPGETQEVVINAPAGSYEFYCNVPGHKQAGMVGTLTVE